MSPENLHFWDNLTHPENNRFLRQRPALTQPHVRTSLRVGWLTAARVRAIRLPLSWRPVSDDNKNRAKLPENPANIALSGQKDLLINGWAVVRTIILSS